MGAFLLDHLFFETMGCILAMACGVEAHAFFSALWVVLCVGGNHDKSLNILYSKIV